MNDLPTSIRTSADVVATIRALGRRLAHVPGDAARLARRAEFSLSLDELEETMALLYAIALEAHDPFAPDLADMVLVWVEEVRPTAGDDWHLFA